MALTLNKLAEVTQDGVRIIHGTITTDSSHAAGGEDFPIASIGLTTLKALYITSVGGYVMSWNGSTSDPELDAYQSAAATGEVAAAAALAEAATVDLSTLVIPFIAIGI